MHRLVHVSDSLKKINSLIGTVLTGQSETQCKMIVLKLFFTLMMVFKLFFTFFDSAVVVLVFIVWINR